MGIDIGSIALLVVVLGTIGIYGIAFYGINAEIEENLEEYGLKVTNQEIECWKTCNKSKDYFYSGGGLFASEVCKCGNE